MDCNKMKVTLLLWKRLLLFNIYKIIWSIISKFGYVQLLIITTTRRHRQLIFRTETSVNLELKLITQEVANAEYTRIFSINKYHLPTTDPPFK